MFKDFLSPEELEKQEHLSLDRLKTFVEKDIKSLSNSDLFTSYPKPKEYFIDLMDWVSNVFSPYLKDSVHLNKFVHNRIIIDGQFLEFCDSNKVSVECLYKESIVSWKTDHNYEKFFVQGVFLIKYNNTEFLHAALYIKGTQYEDEISFFTVVSEKNFEGYVQLRNMFDDWVQKRDRSNLFIRVVGGEDIPYTREYTWDDLFYPNEMKIEIKNSVEGFLASKDFYLKNKIPWKTGILLFGPAGCGKTSLIRTIISLYNFKPVTIVAESNNEGIREAFSYAEQQSPSLLYFEDLDSLFDKGIDTSTFLNLMDGIASKNGLLVLATANNIKRLKANITDRPSRFDRKYEVPLPTKEMAIIYLKKWFGNIITSTKCNDLAKIAEKQEFSYAYLKELYISSMFEALSNNRQKPTIKDIDIALARLIKDKNLLGSKVVNTSKYLNQE